MIYQRTAPVYRSFNNRYSILLPMASLQEKLPNVRGESPNLKVLPLALLEVGSTWNKFFWLSPVNAMAPVHIFPEMSGQSRSITAAYVYKSYNAGRLRNISNSALACSRLRDSRVPFSFPCSPLSESLEQANSA